MSNVGRCYDNARMESFLATLKKEKLYQMDTTKMTTAEVKTVIYRYICYYNLGRIYSTNNGWPDDISEYVLSRSKGSLKTAFLSLPCGSVSGLFFTVKDASHR